MRGSLKLCGPATQTAKSRWRLRHYVCDNKARELSLQSLKGICKSIITLFVKTESVYLCWVTANVVYTVRTQMTVTFNA